MPDESTDLMDAIERFKNRSYMADIAGELSATKYAPSLTNLSDALIVSAHGSAGTGFLPDKTATNALAKIIKERVDSGGDALTLEDIAKTLGPATNEIKRVIIDACYAAGYNYNTVKKLFPKLEQLVAPSTDKPTSAAYVPNLVYQKPTWAQYPSPNLSPFFSITPTSTNLIRSSQDWNAPKGVSVPLPKEEVSRLKEFKQHDIPAVVTNYSGKATIPMSEFKRRIAAAMTWQKEQLSKPGRKTDAEFEDILAQTKAMIEKASEE